MTNIVCTLIKKYRASGTQKGRCQWALSGPDSEIDKVVEHQGQYLVAGGQPVNGKVLISGPYTLSAIGTQVDLIYAENLDRYYPDSTESKANILDLEEVNASSISDSAKSKLESQIIDNSSFSRAQNRVSRFSAPQVASTTPASQPVPEPEATAEDGNLDQPLEEKPKAKAKK